LTQVEALAYPHRVSDATDHGPWHRYQDAMTASTKLFAEDGESALRIVDDAIALAISEHENKWILTLSHHAANISTFLGRTELVKRYYQQSLDFSPENPRALSGLARAAKEEGDLEKAKDYAARSYKALMNGDDFLKDVQLEMLLKDWPELK
jgi:hypothetical protein